MRDMVACDVPAADRESQVRYYSRTYGETFIKAKNAIVTTERGASYIDFFSGAGALNYGHNNDRIKDAVLEYFRNDGIVHSLDLKTTARNAFMAALQDRILEPRGLDYRIQFTGPTGTNAVEASLKLARLATGRTTVVAFTNAFHGVSLGALAACGNHSKRAGAGVPLPHIFRLPYDGYGNDTLCGLDFLETALADPSSGLDRPAAVIVETVQAEGGINVASAAWLRRLARICRQHGIVLVADEIQVGCGRTGTFFSFERAGIMPDVVCLSKSIGGIGFPMAIVLIRPDLDVWQPGQHNGTFRGNNLAFVAGTEAIDAYWSSGTFAEQIAASASMIRAGLDGICALSNAIDPQPRGLGMIQGFRWRDPAHAAQLVQAALAEGVLIETCGPQDEVVKILPPLTIEPTVLADGMQRLRRATDIVLARNA